LAYAEPDLVASTHALHAAGWSTDVLTANSPPLLKQWCSEQDLLYTTEKAALLHLVESFRPQVVLLLDPALITASFSERLRPHTQLIATQIDSSYTRPGALSTVDILLSASASIVHDLCLEGLPAHYLAPGFHEPVLPEASSDEALPSLQLMVPYDAPASEVEQVNLLLEQTGAIRVNAIPSRADSLTITIIDRPHGLTNTACQEIFSASGVGNLVLTNHAPFLGHLYTLGKEVITYRSHDECVSLCQFFNQEPKLATTIAKAGQARTLRDHSKTARATTLVTILESYIKGSPVVEPWPIRSMAGVAEHEPMVPLKKLTAVQSLTLLTELDGDLKDLDAWFKALVEEPGQVRPAYLQWHERLPPGLTKSYLNTVISRSPQYVLSTQRRLTRGLETLKPRLQAMLAWLTSHTETDIPSYGLESTNQDELINLIHMITHSDHETIESYFSLLENDTQIRDFIHEASGQESGEIETEPRYARHLLWYTLVRITKPQNLLIIGTGDYLLPCVLKLALQHNLAEGAFGRLTMVGPGCSPGFLGDAFIKRHTQSATEDIGTGLGNLSQVDAVLFSAKASSDDEYNLYKFLWPKLSPDAWLASENLRGSTALAQASRESHCPTYSWTERPAQHFVEGTTVGLTLLSKATGDSPT